MKHIKRNRTPDLWVLFSQVLVEDNTEVAQQLLLSALLHHDGNTRDEVGGLLADACCLIVQPPLDDTADRDDKGTMRRGY